MTVSHPPIQRFEFYNNAQGVIRQRRASVGGTVQYLGRHDPKHCESSCLRMVPRCWSYVRMKENGECYGIMHPGWSPSYDNTTESGYIEWPCRHDEDCSLNGKCFDGACKCRQAWDGHRCQSLATLPAKRGAGYRRVDNGRNRRLTSTTMATLRASQTCFAAAL